MAPLLSPRALFVALALSAGLAACGGTGQPPSTERARPLAPWSGPLAGLFADTLDPAALGLAALPESPRSDGALRARAENASYIVRVRVSTATADSIDQRRQYLLVLTPFDAPFAADGAVPEKFELTVDPGTPAFGLVKAMDTRMLGRTFIGFFRTFAGTQGPELHWHLAPDVPETAAAVRDAAALNDLSRR